MRSGGRNFFSTLLLVLVGCGTAWADAAYQPSGVSEKKDTYTFAIHPYAPPQELFETYDLILRYLESKIPGVRFQFEASKNYADFESKLAAQRVHFAMPNPYQTVLSLKYGYRVIAKMTPDDDFRGVLVTRADSKLNTLADLRGKTLCFPSATAVAATMLPLLYLHDHGVNIKQDLKIQYVGSQFSSIFNAYSEGAAACGTSTRFWRGWSRENPDKAKKMKVLFTTAPLPHNSIVAQSGVPARVAQQVALALAGIDRDPAVDQRQFKMDQAHFELANDATYNQMSDFLKRYDQTIGLPESMNAQ